MEAQGGDPKEEKTNRPMLHAVQRLGNPGH